MRWAVFSGGGAYGAFQARCLLVLAREGQSGYDGAAGTSVGALASIYTQQFTDFQEAAEGYWDIWENLRRKQVWKHHFPLGPVHGVWKPSVFNSNPLRHLIAAGFNHDRLAASGKLVRVNAFNLQTRQMEWARETNANLVEWVLASSAFPVMFNPITIGGQQYIDGGVHTTTPLSEAIRCGATEIDVFFTGRDPRTRQRNDPPATWAGEVAIRALETLIEGVQRKDLQQAELYNRLVAAGADTQKRIIKFRVFEPDEDLPGGPLTFDPLCTEQMARVADRVVERMLTAGRL